MRSPLLGSVNAEKPALDGLESGKRTLEDVRFYESEPEF